MRRSRRSRKYFFREKQTDRTSCTIAKSRMAQGLNGRSRKPHLASNFRILDRVQPNGYNASVSGLDAHRKRRILTPILHPSCIEHGAPMKKSSDTKRRRSARTSAA